MFLKPIILYEGKYSCEDVNKLKNNYPISKLFDIYELQLIELFEINNPHLRSSPNYQNQLEEFKKNIANEDSQVKGNWIYYPWNNYLIHAVNQQQYFNLRTNRNLNLITLEEQNKLQDACIAIAGLSIGSHFVESLIYSGIGNILKIAEFDKIETTNLNRMRCGLHDVGTLKIATISQHIYEINPYIDIIPFESGLNIDNLDNFLIDHRKPSLIFEAVDDFEIKVRLRLVARREKIPVIMLTNLGDNLMVDIERYDLNPNLNLFNGLLGNITEEILNSSLSEKEKIKFVIKIVGLENIPTRALVTLLEINKTLVGRPQLYSTVTVSGGISAYLAKRIILGKDLQSGRYYISFDKLFNTVESLDGGYDRARIITELEELLK